MASISSVTTLATFITSQASSSSNSRKHVYLSQVDGSNGSLAVAAVQGDGVWTYDVRTLRPTTSFTVHPSTIFTTRPVSYQPLAAVAAVKGKGKSRAEPDEGNMEVDVSSTGTPDGPDIASLRVTAVGVTTKSTGKQKRKTGSLWIWRGEDAAARSEIELPSAIQALHRVESARYPFLLLLDTSELILLDDTHTLRPLQLALPTPFDLLSSRIIPFDSTASGLILLDQSGHLLTIRVDHPDEGVISARISNDRTLLSENEKLRLASGDVFENGTTIVLDNRRNRIITQENRLDACATSIVSRAPISPCVLALPGDKPLVLHAVSKPEPSLLLTLASSGTPAVLSTTEISAISPDCNITEINVLGRPTPTTCTVGFVAWHAHSDGTGGRSVLHICEVSTPARSWGLSSLIGSHARTERYFEASSSVLLASREDTSKSVANTESFREGNAESSFTSTEGKIDELLAQPISASTWTSLADLIRTNSTLSSGSLVRIIKQSLADDHLASVYTALLSTPPPSADFRVEFRQSISVEEATKVLEFLAHAVAQWCERRIEGLSWPSSVESQFGRGRKPDPLASNDDLPALPALLAHTSTLLDSHLPLFLGHPPSFPILESLSTSITPILLQQGEIRKLQAPLDALLTLAKREERRKAEERKKKDALRQISNYASSDKGRKGGQRGKGQAGSGSGEGRLPGEEIGKYRVEDLAF